ncbi:conserved hypothetical protein [Xenorhabdus bovienii str. puntauvense]|uniref:Uncharacterized protein n=1 Tax=Xenorhabdus bovienii str. puntauvense TaxID=1398201 RepID=A0A077NH59_XENBV|nr:hypothetical protein [Xenorhabdus bovienii]CDG97728.1 conserved hypothetical protein [Xenorhabdus bovienii str. puntauvense]
MNDTVINLMAIATMALAFWYFTVYRKKQKLLKAYNLQRREVINPNILKLYQELDKTIDKRKYFILLKPRLNEVIANDEGFDQATIRYILHNPIDMTICNIESRTALLGVIFYEDSLKNKNNDIVYAVKTNMLNGAEIGICTLSQNDIESDEKITESASIIIDFVQVNS